MRLLFIDTESTGLPDMRRSCSWPGQPRIVQFGAILTDLEGQTKAEVNLIVKQAGPIPEEVSKLHGITTDDADRYGVGIERVLGVFASLAVDKATVVAHNVPFDIFMMRREFEAFEPFYPRFTFTTFCTMQASTPVVKMPPTERMLAAGRNGFKSPSMREAYRHFFGKDFDGAHDAMADVRACRDVYFALRKVSEA